ncbi:MAG: universal stress protein [Rhodobacteraceae bacterium]|nr:universal stress protein [Paracoccaceae bacterium]
MAIKNILVAYSGSQSSKSAVKLARLMKNKYDAHLTGALTYAPSEISTTLRPYASADLGGIIRDAEKARRDAIRAEFFEVLGEPESKTTHWVEAGGDVDYSLMELARTYDIVLVGQYDGTRENRNLVPHPDVIALNSGRPVMVVPQDLPDNVLNDKAVLAWDGGKSAARAMADALDILETKSDIAVVSVGDGSAEALQRLQSVTDHLATHGIASNAEIVPRSRRSIGKVLLETVESHGAGLLIMGAYEHSKFFEDIWGGATNAAIARAKVPVLMSH